MYEVIVAILIGLDQIIKYWALNYLQVVESIPVINNIFNLTGHLYEKNSKFLNKFRRREIIHSNALY